ncbi:MAG: hypothetical protein AB7G17_10570 [Phycisphaerales bacterium]
MGRGLGALAAIAGGVMCAAPVMGQAGAASPDLNRDGVVNDRDVVEWLRAFLGRQSLPMSALRPFDLNGDGGLSGHDIGVFSSAMGAEAYGRLNFSAMWSEAASLGWYDERVDFDHDGRLSQEDVMIWLTALVAPQTLPPAIVAAADVNGDGARTGHDLSVLLSAMGGAGQSLNVAMLRRQIEQSVQPPSTGGGTTPGGSTPGGSTPGGATPPGGSTNGGSSSGSNPGGSAPGGATPGSSTPPSTSAPSGGTSGGGSTYTLVIPGGGPGPGTNPAPLATVVGSGRGADARAIARFDTVPNQTISGQLNVGVVAFHMNGIDRVEFSANGGAWVATNEMRMNEATGVWEYWATLRASDFPDGLVEVRAVAVPRVGVPRDLGVLPVYANSRSQLPSTERYVSVTGDDVAGDGTRERPYRSIFRAAFAIGAANNGIADGGQVYLLPGEYDWGRAGYNANGQYIGNVTTRDRWLTVSAAPGVSRDDVRIVSSTGGGLKTQRVRASNVTIVSTELDNAVPTGTSPMLWIDNCKMLGRDRVTDMKWASIASFPGGMYFTDSHIISGRYGVIGAQMVRGVTVESTGDDTFTNCAMVVNCTARDIRTPDGYDFHADVVQLHASETGWNNVIVYNVRAIDCVSQGWHIGYTGHRKGPDWTDIAFVNYLVDIRSPDYTAQWIPSANHVLWWNMTMLGGPVIVRDNPNSGGGHGEATTIRNFDVRNCVMQKLIVQVAGTTPRASDPLWATNNHFIDSTSYAAMVAGTGATAGGSAAQLFANASGGDFRSTGTVLRNRMPNPVIIIDAQGRRVESARAIGALQP